jgi:Lrp/AsnC family leucine-responsive transcriptional regulator
MIEKPDSGPVALDDVDRRLLNALQDDCQRSVLELARAASTSVATCHRRLQRLRASGVIEREAAILRPERTARGLIIFVEVALERHEAAAHAAFEDKMRAAPEVSQCYNTSGQTDYIVVMNVADVPAYHEAATRLFSSDPGIRTFRSTISIKRVKFDTRIPL